MVEAMTSNREKRAGEFAELPLIRKTQSGDIL
jgi:hypothetical protein